MRWRILALLFAARTGLGFQFQTLASVGDDLVVAFGLDHAGVGLLIGLFMAPGLLLALPAGLAGRYAPDRVLVGLGLGAIAVGGLVSAGAADAWTIGLGRIVAGAGFLLCTLFFAKMTADWFEGREIATAMSVLVLSWPLGIAMGQVGHAWLAETQGWRVPFLAASAFCALAATAVLLLYRLPTGTDHGPDRAAGAVRTQLTGREWRLILCAGAAFAFFNGGYVVYLGFGPAMLVALGAPALVAAGIISVGSWLIIVSGILCGQIVDRFGRREVILAVCMTGAVAALILLGVPGAGLPASVLFGLVGMAPAGVIMALAGAAVARERRAFGMGVFFMVYYSVMTVAPPIAGALLDATGSPGASLAFGMVLFALVVPAVLLFGHIQSREAAEPAVPGAAAKEAAN